LNTEDLLTYTSDPSLFFSELTDFRRDSQEDGQKLRPEILVSLHEEHNIDICDLAVQAVQKGTSAFDVMDIIDGNLFDLTNSAENLITYWEVLYEKAKNDLAAGLQFDPFKNISDRHTVLLKEVISKLKSIQKEFVPGYLSMLIKNVPFLSPFEKYAEARTLCNDEKVEQCMAGIQLMTMLITTDMISDDEKKDGISVLYDLINKDNEKLESILVWAVCQIYQKQPTEDALHIIHGLRIKGKPESIYNISQFLSSNEKLLPSDEHLQSLFLTLTDTKCELKGIIRNLDYILMNLLKSDFDLCYSFFCGWIEKSDYRRCSERICDIWEAFCNQIFSDDVRLQIILLRFFNSDNPVYHKAVSDIVEDCFSHNKKELSFSVAELAACTIDDIKYILRKILGYVIFSEQVCSLCFSLAEIFADNKNILDMIYHLFADDLCREYPLYVKEYFERKKQSPTKKENLVIFIKDILQRTNQYIRFREQLKPLKELKVSYSMRIELARKRQQQQNEIEKKSENRSLLFNLLTNVSIKYGTGSTMYFNNKYGELSHMHEISVEFTQPCSEVFSSVDAAMIRYDYQRAKRG
jgi:hypothetical protein